MATLFQLHADMTRLKSLVRELAPLWQAGDSILLLGDTAGFIEWFNEYVQDLNDDEESEFHIRDIQSLYILQPDVAQLSDSARMNIDFTNAHSLSYSDWVDLTDKFTRVVTLNSTL